MVGIPFCSFTTAARCADMGCPGTGMLRRPLQRNRTQNVAATLAGKVAELNLGQYEPELLKLAVRHAVSPAEAAFYLREIQVWPCA